MDKLIGTLQEREKELDCLYRIQRLTLTPNLPFETVVEKVVEEVGVGWQHPETTGCCVDYFGRRYASSKFDQKAPQLIEPLRRGGREIGSICVSDCGLASSETFLTEERILLETISWLLSNFVAWRHLGILGRCLPSLEDSHWQWRERLVSGIVQRFDEGQFGPTEIYLGGSTQRGEATHGSDIDLYIYHQGSQTERERLRWWIDGWSQSVAESARIQTGEIFPDGVISIVWMAGRPDSARFPEYRKIL